MIPPMNFKRGSINFHKQRKWPAKYQHLGIAPLTEEMESKIEKCREKEYRSKPL